MIPRALYRLADALELTLEFDGGRVRGKRTRKLELAGVPVSGELEVVSSVLLEGGAALLLQATGRLGLMASHVDPEGLGLALLDLDRLVAPGGRGPEALFEQNCPTDLAGVRALLAPAVVARFSFQDGSWLAAAAPPA